MSTISIIIILFLKRDKNEQTNLIQREVPSGGHPPYWEVGWTVDDDVFLLGE